GQNLAQSETEYASILMAGLIVVPQIVVALLSPWVGYYSEKWGRKPLLLLGFGLEIIRALLFAFFANVSLLLTAQLLCGISAEAITVLRRNGIYNYAHYHSRTHEVLGVARGHARVRFGGERGKELRLKVGDVVVLPAGRATSGSPPARICWWSA